MKKSGMEGKEPDNACHKGHLRPMKSYSKFTLPKFEKKWHYPPKYDIIVASYACNPERREGRAGGHAVASYACNPERREEHVADERNVLRMRGKITCVGVGPGDPELLTIKAVRVMKEADVLAFPYSNERSRESVAYGIAVAACGELAGKEQLPLFCPMTRDEALRKKCQEEAVNSLLRLLEQGRSVAYLTLGDPMIYCTYSMFAKPLEEQGYSTEYVPGVPSFCAVAAKLGMPIANGRESVRILPAANELPKPCVGETLIFMKASDRIKALKKIEELKNGTVKAVSNCGMEGESVYETLETIPENAGYFTVVMAKK